MGSVLPQYHAAPAMPAGTSGGTAEYQDVDGCTELSGPARGRGDEQTAGRKRGENLREDFRTTEPFCFPARGSLRPRLAQAHRSLRPHASTHGSRPRLPQIRTHPAREPRGRRNAAEHRTDRLGAQRRPLTAPSASSIAPCITRSPRGRGRISFPPSLQHPPRTHTPGTSRGSGMAAPGCRPHGPGAPPPARQMVNYIHSRILRWDRVSDNEPVLFD